MAYHCCGTPHIPENAGHRCSRCGGILTDISKLPIGASFYVNNGDWHGKIVLNDGKPCIKISGVGSSEITPGDERNILALSDIKYPKES